VLPQAFYSTAYNNSNVQTAQISSYRLRGNVGNALPVQAGDYVMHMPVIAYIDSGNSFAKIADLRVEIQDTDQAGTYSGRQVNDVRGANSKIVNSANQTIFTLDNSTFVANATIYGNGYINTNNRIEYLRTFGSFSSNVTQTSAGANTVNYMTLNNTETANGVSIVSNSQVTVSRSGTYNIQFSAQVTHDTNATANIEIWLAKNGNAIANTNSRLTLQKDQPVIAAWNWVDTVSTANDYYQIGWASPDTNMELIAIDSANTIANVSIPSVIITVVPVGA
jgi:hypothetical protein